MSNDSLFRNNIEMLAFPYEALLAGIREGHVLSDTTSPYVALGYEAQVLSNDALVVVGAMQREIEAMTWEEVVGWDYDELSAFSIPALYMRNLYNAIKEEIEDVLGEDVCWRVDVPEDLEDTGIRIDGHLIRNYQDWIEHLIEQSGFIGHAKALANIGQHKAFDDSHPLIKSLREKSVVEVIHDNLLTMDQLETLELDLRLTRLPYQMRATLTAAYLIKVLIEANLNAQYKGYEIVILDSGLCITMGRSIKLNDPALPLSNRHVTALEVSDMSEVSALIV